MAAERVEEDGGGGDESAIAVCGSNLSSEVIQNV